MPAEFTEREMTAIADGQRLLRAVTRDPGKAKIRAAFLKGDKVWVEGFPRREELDNYVRENDVRESDFVALERPSEHVIEMM